MPLCSCAPTRSSCLALLMPVSMRGRQPSQRFPNYAGGTWGPDATQGLLVQQGTVGRPQWNWRYAPNEIAHDPLDVRFSGIPESHDGPRRDRAIPERSSTRDRTCIADRNWHGQSTSETSPDALFAPSPLHMEARKWLKSRVSDVDRGAFRGGLNIRASDKPKVYRPDCRGDRTPIA